MIARRLVRMGFGVVLVASRPEGVAGEEWIDGYRVIRVGGKITVYPGAKRVYRKLKRGVDDRRSCG